jgi:hypothetical protein
VFHDEVNGIAPFSAAKTFKKAFSRRYRKRGRFFVVKRAQTKLVDPPSFKGDKLRDDICNLGSVYNPVDGCLVDHAHKSMKIGQERLVVLKSNWGEKLGGF